MRYVARCSCIVLRDVQSSGQQVLLMKQQTINHPISAFIVCFLGFPQENQQPTEKITIPICTNVGVQESQNHHMREPFLTHYVILLSNL